MRVQTETILEMRPLSNFGQLTAPLALMALQLTHYWRIVYFVNPANIALCQEGLKLVVIALLALSAAEELIDLGLMLLSTRARVLQESVPMVRSALLAPLRRNCVKRNIMRSANRPVNVYPVHQDSSVKVANELPKTVTKDSTAKKSPIQRCQPMRTWVDRVQRTISVLKEQELLLNALMVRCSLRKARHSVSPALKVICAPMVVKRKSAQLFTTAMGVSASPSANCVTMATMTSARSA